MEYILLGRTGLRMSRIALGTALLGLVPAVPEAEQLVMGALDLGINVFDCANTYGNRAAFDRPGMPSHTERESAETILGRALKNHRDDVVLCTKVSEPVGPGVNDAADFSGGLSRYHIVREVERSLRRLNTDHIDIYHAHHADPATSIEETLETFDDLVRQGKVRYVALSTFNAWQMTQAVMTSDRYNLARPVLNQSGYNMISRRNEQDVIPAALELGLQLTCQGPLAGGALAGLDSMNREYSGVRRWIANMSETQLKRWGSAGGWSDAQKDAATKLEGLAKDWGYAPAPLALHWLLSRPAIACAVIGPESLEELKQDVGVFDVKIDEAQYEQLDTMGRA